MREKISEMETKTFVFWGESDSHKFSANIHSDLFFLIFQGLQTGGRQAIVRLQRNFLWSGAADQNKIPWIRWETICLPKAQGGLGVKDITSFIIVGKVEIGPISESGGDLDKNS